MYGGPPGLGNLGTGRAGNSLTRQCKRGSEPQGRSFLVVSRRNVTQQGRPGTLAAARDAPCRPLTLPVTQALLHLEPAPTPLRLPVATWRSGGPHLCPAGGAGRLGPGGQCRLASVRTRAWSHFYPGDCLCNSFAVQ